LLFKFNVYRYASADALAAAVAPWIGAGRGSPRGVHRKYSIDKQVEKSEEEDGGTPRGVQALDRQTVRREAAAAAAAAVKVKVNHAPDGVPRQVNGHDCGLYVLAVADAVCEAHAAELGLESEKGGRAAGRGDWTVHASTEQEKDEGEGEVVTPLSTLSGEAEVKTLTSRLDAITPGFIEGFRFELLDLVETLSA
jgi:hypothetical protein